MCLDIIITMNNYIEKLLKSSISLHNLKSLYLDLSIKKDKEKNLKICFIDYNDIHYKNKLFIEYFINKYPYIVNTLQEADIVISGKTFIDPSKYPDKLFIFGPHFTVLPNESVNFNNKYSNAYYNLLSEWVKNLWIHFKYDNIPIITLPYGVDTEIFKPNKNRNERDLVILYYKDRNLMEFLYIIHILVYKNINVKVFNYSNGYSEEEYIESLKNAKYAIWLGRHESQGFALQECLSCDVPILVWNVTKMSQEEDKKEEYKDIDVDATVIPYWNDNCGEYFLYPHEFENIFNKFLNNLDNYKPREYILSNLSKEVCYNNWLEFIKIAYKKINYITKL